MLVLITSADIEHQHKKMRTEEYRKTISWMKQNLGDNNFLAWIECVRDSGSFIEEYHPVFYSNVNNPKFSNTGANWGKAIEEFISHHDIHEEFIAHITGRYHLKDRHFIDMIEENPDYDVFAKDDGHSQYITGCFAMRAKYFIDWIHQTDWNWLNSTMTNLEKSVWNYSKNKNLKCYEFDSLHIDCNIFGKGSPVRIQF
tara:strand:+ start:921 stop:1517 length:597 start_codon:yes stop_codon:yes gene_type:complete